MGTPPLLPFCKIIPANPLTSVIVQFSFLPVDFVSQSIYPLYCIDPCSFDTIAVLKEVPTMFQLHLSENLIRLRRDRKITQEELADFIGVTKAAVSKWENAQTTPDILLLPRLASFFDVTIDRLLGYEAQLSREQIRRCYMELYQDFANLPFSEVWEKVRSTAHRYYSCYPLLLQLCVLYLNHFMVAVKKETTVLFSTHILSDVEHICDELAFLHEGRIALKGTLEEVRKIRRTAAVERMEPALEDLFMEVIRK